MTRSSWLVILLLTVGVPTTVSADTLPAKALELSDRGLAELENEKPDNAEAIYRELTTLVPDDPLGHANLAIALLRQQKHADAATSIKTALEKAPGRGDLLAIQGEVLQWKGDLEEALAQYADAMEASPDDIEILWAALQQARTVQGEEADAIARSALFRLSRLRPENLLVLLQLGQGAIARGNRQVATVAFGRIDELLWQADPIAERAMGMVRDALEGDDLAGARVPAIRLENVLKVTPMYRESLRELKTGIQGIPVRRFSIGEPDAEAPDRGLEVKFTVEKLDDRPGRRRGLVVADLDGDEKPEVARIRLDADGKTSIAIRSATDLRTARETPAPGSTTALLDADLDNDGRTDLVAGSPTATYLALRPADGYSTEVADWQSVETGSVTLVAVDFDIEGDLDLVVAGPTGSVALLRNDGSGRLDDVTEKSFPPVALEGTVVATTSDLDRDGDLDVVLGDSNGIHWLDNLRQGRFGDRTAAAQLEMHGMVNDLVASDMTNDGWPDLVVATSSGVLVLENRGGTFIEAQRIDGLEGERGTILAFDADNDGRLDLAAAGPTKVDVALARAEGTWAVATPTEPIEGATALQAADLDADGDLDLVVSGSSGLHVLTNEGGNANGWLDVRLRGLVEGNSKNNLRGEGSVVEIRNGGRLQFREARGDTTHFGIGQEDAADVLRVVWTNGVPQNRLDVEGSQRVVEEQLLKGSCPFVYVWNGEEFEFVTDLLWGAPIGLPVAEGVYAASDPGEIIRLDGLVADDRGRWQLRITEELWEAAFFDQVRLWVVDHPEDVVVASNLRIVPGASPVPEQILATRGLRPVVKALDGKGRDVTERVRFRDEIYADGYLQSPYQGVAASPWATTFDLGSAPAQSVRLHLEGWIFPSDASLNLALDQREGPSPTPPRLEVEVAGHWETLMPNMGFPAGKTKTMVVDTPPLPEGASQLRIVTGQWLHWDRITWSTEPVDELPRVRARLLPARSDLRYRGFGLSTRQAPNAPHEYEYARTSTTSPWLPFPGRYTRYGDVGPLLSAVDDLSVVLAAGDEIVLEFDGSSLDEPAPGTRRTLFLESVGWDKDADRNTGAGRQVEPLPFHAMSTYPYGPLETFPSTPRHLEYLEHWQTRVIESSTDVMGDGIAP